MNDPKYVGIVKSSGLVELYLDANGDVFAVTVIALALTSEGCAHAVTCFGGEVSAEPPRVDGNALGIYRRDELKNDYVYKRAREVFEEQRARFPAQEPPRRIVELATSSTIYSFPGVAV